MRLLGNMTSPETTFWVNPVEGGRCLCSKVNRLAPRTDGGVVGAHKIRSLVTAMVSAAILCSVAMAVAATKSAAKKKKKKQQLAHHVEKWGSSFHTRMVLRVREIRSRLERSRAIAGRGSCSFEMSGTAPRSYVLE